MSKICQITGKKAMIGNNVSHSNCWISLNICANGLRVINKKGLDAALNEAVAKGYCDWKTIKIIG